MSKTRRLTPVLVRGRKTYCSGVLINADLSCSSGISTRLVLTCAHFFRGLRDEPVFVSAYGFRIRVEAVRTVKGTDLAVAYLAESTPPMVTAEIATTVPAIGNRSITYGFGGNSRTPLVRHGYVLGRLPFSISYDLKTVVRHAVAIFNRNSAVYGDSGGPIVVNGSVVATQSLIASPFGVNTHVATGALVAPHAQAIRRTCVLLQSEFEH